MSVRSYSSHRRSKSNYEANQIPNNFRVLLKSRSGKFNDSQPTLSPLSINHNATQHSIKTKFNGTSNSFYEPDIKGFVKSMQNKQNVSEFNNNVRLFHDDKSEYKEKNLEESKEKESEERKEDEREERREKYDGLSQTMLNNSSELNIEKLSSMNLEEIDSKIDELLKIKLLRTKESRTHRTIEINEIQKQINIIIEYLQNYSFFHEQKGTQDNLEFTNQRITILEKIMAEGAIESEIAKKYFFAKKAERKPKIINIWKYKTDLSFMKEKTKNLIGRKVPASLHFETISKEAFQAPNKEDYPLKPQKTEYQSNNQPMHRSSYDRDYLMYGNLPRFSYKEETQSDIFIARSTSVGESAYRKDFTEKKVEKMNIKELDCYHDKFKTLKISFAPVTKEKIKTMGSYSKEWQNKSEKMNKTERHKTENNHYINNLASESRISYRGENNWLKSEIKHKNLHSLKYAYKAAVNL